jgi:Trp operon repressor
MEWKQQLKEWKKKRMKIYEEFMKGKKSQRQIATEYGLSNTRIADICKQVEKDLTRL